ncbi:TPA: SctW family type III secretion system gatekeeper subunit PopN [Pseudomonas aeruginosa]|nr:SctW family type III secretion system gatekeeper subunit PopN [Pseudomonas aeruginosa]
MDILQSSSAAPLAPREAANAPAQQAGGSFQGERVHYVSVSQSLADAAEELTFAFSERAEKSLAKRRLSDAHARLSDAHARLSEVQAMLQEYWKRIPDLESQQKLEALIAHLGSGQLSSLAQLSAYLEGFSSEISQRFLALSRARDVLAGRPEARAMLALVDQALLRMADEQGLEIELGLRIEPLAAEASAAGVGDIQALRDTYRDAVLDYRGLSAAWQDIQARFAATPLERVVAFLQKALSADLDSQSSRLDPVKLERVMSDMHKLRVLGGLAEQVGALWQVLVTGERGHGIRAF